MLLVVLTFPVASVIVAMSEGWEGKEPKRLLQASLLAAASTIRRKERKKRKEEEKGGRFARSDLQRNPAPTRGDRLSVFSFGSH